MRTKTAAKAVTKQFYHVFRVIGFLNSRINHFLVKF